MKLELVFTIAIFGFAGYKIVSYLFDKFGGKSSQNHSSGERVHDEERSQEETSGASRNESAWWNILGVKPDSSAIEIRAAYRSLISKYHPDKVESLGEEFKEIARNKSQEINAAYERARVAKNF
jgi:hypothetical protein